MTAPQFNTLPANEPDPVKRANWLGRYLDVEKGYDEKLKVVLLDSLSGIDDAFEKVGDSDKIGKRVRKQQLALSNKAVRNTINGIFGANANLIKSSQSDAAVAAVDAGLYDQRGILATLFKDPTQRKQYAESLRLTAARNIDAVMTRTLESQKPLSRKVYRTQALANGQVDRIINRALAKGDSAADIAKAVKGLIDPNVPGGVSYAARRLGRTEINNAFHAQAIHDAQENPFVTDMRWNLSKRHEDDPGDECEEYASIGTFPKEHVPDKPHPNCRCYVTAELEPYEDFETKLVSGQYDSQIDDVFGLKPVGDGPQVAYELTPEKQAKIDAIVARAKATEEAKKEAKRQEAQRLSQLRAADKAEKDAAKTAAAEKAAARNVVDTDKTIPKSISEAVSPKQVQNFLHDNYLGLRVEGFDTADIDLRFAQEIGIAFERQIEIHPRTTIRKLKVEYLDEGETARTEFNLDGKGRSDIVFNRSLASDYERYKQLSKAAQESKFHGKRDTSKPWEGNFIHEWGHVLDYSGGSIMQRSLAPIFSNGKVVANIGDELKNTFVREVLGLDPNYDTYTIDQSAYEAWVLDGMPSGYSFKDEERTMLNPPESVAESYADSVMNQEPSSVAKTIARKLIKFLAENKSMVVGVRKKEK